MSKPSMRHRLKASRQEMTRFYHLVAMLVEMQGGSIAIPDEVIKRTIADKPVIEQIPTEDGLLLRLIKD